MLSNFFSRHHYFSFLRIQKDSIVIIKLFLLQQKVMKSEKKKDLLSKRPASGRPPDPKELAAADTNLKKQKRTFTKEEIVRIQAQYLKPKDQAKSVSEET